MKCYDFIFDWIIVEVLELVFLDDYGLSYGVILGEFYDMGVYVEFDDFGIGYVLLIYVVDLLINGLKIDCLFMW